MRHTKFLVAAARGFAADRRGNFAVIFGFIAAVLILAVGYGVDLAQLFNTKSSLQNAVDAAVTSTARGLTVGDVTPNDAETMVKAFLAANGSGGLLRPGQIVLDRLSIDQVARTVEVEAHADVPLFFPVFGPETNRRVTAATSSLYSDKTVEVSMMLDVTGSMAGQKIKDLKTAASNAVDSFLNGQDPTKPRIRVAIVPYANSVNTGALADSTVYVETKASERKQAPGNMAPRAASASPRPDTCATERKGAYQYSDAGPDVSMVNRDLLLSDFAGQTRTSACPSAALMPLTANGARLKDVISKFSASGGTAGHIGIQWGWYMLSANWSSVFAASERPAPMDARKVSKIAILMTDGEFNLSYFDAASPAEVYDDNGKEPTRTAAKSLCAAMRDQGIEIFTIGFALTEKNAKATLQDCASPDAGSIHHFYQAANGLDLDNAFQAIARNVERLTLTK